MPSLIVSSRNTTDSQILRSTAQQLGWETLRLDGERIPDWFEPGDDRIALFHTAPHAFDVAQQLGRTLLGCRTDWTVTLPEAFLHRQIRQMTLVSALKLPGGAFVKHAISKAFPAGIYDSRSLAEAAAKVSRTALVHVAEPVAWSVEYRCFALERSVATLCPYKRLGRIVEDHSSWLDAPSAEIDAARQFCLSVLKTPAIDCPPAFVLDVGVIENRGWAVVEFNECWASGIYACDPAAVLATLLRACVPTSNMTADDLRWDFRQHYLSACS